MIQEELICPYPGLRTFTEEESIFFKGRDVHIRKASSLLEQRKFLMITGASGEGKSSIVYAGIVPFARGGFIKSEYSNWSVVDFRPERSPLANFSSSLTNAFSDLDENVIQTNLSKGFSSLVELYKNSPLYVNTDSEEWNEADEKGKKILKRRSANLLIIVDQFEEFFTNSENYINGVPSDESALVVSTLLETARIAAMEELPIYIAFTMRSDFIGQCAAFRGLPEFIGYSQFFVPRLKRVDLKRVIQEPAELSGVTITDRLVERLLYDLEDGVDQLPILQHTLNRIWGLAVNLNENLDLIHYAMSGGMPPEELLDDDQKNFKRWHDQLIPQVKKSLENPSLKNVLDAHANQLFFDSTGNNSRSAHILEVSLKCLTAVDEDRAVRNRMTLMEITRIIDDPDISENEVDTLLKVFRQEGNTFIKPYANLESGENIILNSESVIDITHESLIRNWTLLKDWAYDENRDYEVLKELLTQMNHWVLNGKSSAFLLSSGSLNYFEEWYMRVNPNEYWIWRYLKGSSDKSFEEAKESLNNIRDFLKKSINKNFVPRLFARYGMFNVIAGIGTILLIISAVFLTISSRNKQNEEIIELVKRNGIELIRENLANSDKEVSFTVSLLRSDPKLYFEFLDGIPEPQERLLQINNVLGYLIRRDVMTQAEYPIMLLERGHDILDSLIMSEIAPNEVEALYRDYLAILTKAMTLKIHNPNPVFKTLFLQLNNTGRKLKQKILKSPDFYNQANIHSSLLVNDIHAGLESEIIRKDNIFSVLSELSIFSNPSKRKFVFYNNDTISNRLIYSSLMRLHGLNGDIELVKQSFDSLYRDADAEAIPASFFDNFIPASVLVSVYKGSGKQGFKAFINHTASKTKLPIERIYAQLFKFLISSEISHVQRASAPQRIMTLQTIATMDQETIIAFLELYEEVLLNSANDLNQKFELAQYYKFSGLLMDKYWTIHKMDPDTEWLDSRFDKSLEIYNSIKDLLPKRWSFEFNWYLDREVDRTVRFSLSEVYAYPDYVEDGWERHWAKFYSDAFFNYLIKKGIAKEFFSGDSQFPLRFWVHTMNWTRSTDQRSYTYVFDNDLPAKFRLAKTIDSVIDESENEMYASLVKLSAAYYLRWAGQEEEAKEIVNDIDPVKFIEEYDGRTTYELYSSDLMDLIYTAQDSIPSQFFTATDRTFINSGKSMVMFYSLERMAKSSENRDFFNHLSGSYKLFKDYIKNPYFLYGATSLEYSAILGLAKLNSKEMDNYIDRVIIDAEELNLGRNFKLSALRRRVKSFVNKDLYYEAYESIGDASINSRIVLYKYILDGVFYKSATEKELNIWSRYERNMRDANFVTENL